MVQSQKQNLTSRLCTFFSKTSILMLLETYIFFVLVDITDTLLISFI